MDTTNATGDDVAHRVEEAHPINEPTADRPVCFTVEGYRVWGRTQAHAAKLLREFLAAEGIERAAEREFCAAEARSPETLLDELSEGIGRAFDEALVTSESEPLPVDHPARLALSKPIPIPIERVTLPTSLPGTSSQANWKRATVEAIKPSKTVSDALFAFEAAYDAQVEHIVRGFLVPACHYRPADGEKYDPHAPWKLVAYAGGVIAGWVSALDPELVDRTHVAQHMADDCRSALLAADLAEEFWPARRKIAGDNGLPPRVAEALVRMGVER